ncbi:MAG: hypothetical protein OXI96_02975 [Acidimicrobiaceae bacterium]|nr:hypothetical protein [Acidimicrobiaceae bacterium]
MSSKKSKKRKRAKRKRAKKQKKNRRRTEGKQVVQTLSNTPDLPVVPPNPLEVSDGYDEYGSEVLATRWVQSRHGARAGRGFHFQDVVGAWLASRIATGSIGATALVPEGFDDMSFEGSNLRHVQIKSRSQRSGRFSVTEASRVIFDTWDRHLENRSDNSILVVVLERGVKGENDLNNLERTLKDSLSADSKLRQTLENIAQQRGRSVSELNSLLSSSVLVGLSWDEMVAETLDQLACLHSLPPSAMQIVVRQLCGVIAETSDANETPVYEDRQHLTRTKLVSIIGDAAKHIDVNSLESAFQAGICEPLRFEESSVEGDRFYEGAATQPAHVAANLVVPRPDVMAEVLAGLEERSAVVITGPSGVGKSAVLWTVPQALPGVLWFRVWRLLDDDVVHLVNLARTYNVSSEAPVGFLVDSAGTYDFGGWSRLRGEVASVPGILLVGTARSEDLVTLGDLSQCATISVRLDEAAAETIFRGLARRSVTTLPHWSEAFAASGGLTLEFTHLLTRCERLQDVINEQVKRRITEERWLELEIANLVSVADRWTATLSTSDLVSACGVREFEIRKAISRLSEEHLVVERNGRTSGLHRLRSTAVSEAIHVEPPPDIYSSIRRVTSLVPTRQLHRFIVNMLRDIPSAKKVIIEVASREAIHLERLVAYLHGLRLADFYELAKKWKEVADQHEIPASVQSVLFQCTVADIDFKKIFPDELNAAQQAMKAVTWHSSRDELITRIGDDVLADLLASTDDLNEAKRAFAVLEHISPTLLDALTAALSHESPLVQVLKSAPIDVFAEYLAITYSCDRALAETLVDLIGGEQAVIDRLRAHNPWITELEIKTEENNTIAYSRFLHVSDDLQGDPQDEAHALGRLLLRCLPRTESVDVQALMPGGHEMRDGEFTGGISKLQRQYDHHAFGIAWTQARIRATVTLLGETDSVRLANALPLLEQVADLTHEIGTLLVTGSTRNLNIDDCKRRLVALHKKGKTLKPSLGAVELGDTALSEQSSVMIKDNLFGLIFGLTNNVFSRIGDPSDYRRLALYISDTVIGGDLEGAIREPWSLLGISGHPKSLDRLHNSLLDLHAVVRELANNDADRAKITRSALSGKTDQALHRAAKTCRRAHRRRCQTRRNAVQKVCKTTGLRTRVLMDQQDPYPTVEFLVTVELDSLLEWPDALSRLEAAFKNNPRLNGIYRFVPLRNTRPVLNLAMSLSESLLSSPDLGKWTEKLPEAQPSTLVDTFNKAHTALQAISGISHLPESQQDHETIQSVVETAVSQFHEAHDKLFELPQDILIDTLILELQELADRVQAELKGTNTEPSVAEQVVAGVLCGGGTEIYNTMAHVQYFAPEWDIDPEAAVKMLESAQNIQQE